MRKMSTVLASVLVATSILAASLPALADDTTPASVPPAGQVQNAQPGTSTPASPSDKAAARKQKLQNEILNIQKAQQFQQTLGPIHQLQAQDKQLRDQIRVVRKTIQGQVKTDRQAKNYTALLAGLNDMITPLQDDIASAQQAAQATKVDWEQLKTDNKANNTSAVATDLTKIQADIQNRITVYQKVLADLQKITADLALANVTPQANTATPSAVPATTTPAVSAPTT